MSAFGGKADINGRHPMSAFDPKAPLIRLWGKTLRMC
jgi:hypothetical protein